MASVLFSCPPAQARCLPRMSPRSRGAFLSPRRVGTAWTEARPAKIGANGPQDAARWVHRFNTSGLKGLIDNVTEGPKRRLSKEQWEQATFDRGLASRPEDPTPCPNQTTTYPNPNRRPLGRQLCLPISPTSRKTRVPNCSRLLPFCDRRQFAGTTPARKDPKRCDARTGASETRSMRFWKSTRSYGTLTHEIALTQDLHVEVGTPFLERVRGKLQERARAIIERRPDLEHLFDD